MSRAVTLRPPSLSRSLLLLAVTAALVAAVLASDPTSAQTGDTVTVTDEPAGENCEYGGVRITVTHPEPTPDPTEEPTPDPTEEPTPDPTEDPTETPEATQLRRREPDMTFVCNGQSGEPGQDGTDGADGDDGDNGENGMDGMDSDFETPGIQATRSNRCATAGVVKVRVPKRFRNGTRVRVTANGRRRSARVRKRKVAANLSTVPCGYWPVLIQRRGKRSALIVVRLTPRRVVRSTV